MNNSPRTFQAVVRNLVFGVEDSLVSTVGFLAGIASANVPRKTLFLSGIILIVVEALSMGVGSLLAEASVEELRVRHAESRRVVFGGLVMFFSYLLSGLIPLLPYLLFSGQKALLISLGASLTALFLLGWISGKFGKGSSLVSALRMAFLGGLAIAAGVLIGRIVRL